VRTYQPSVTYTHFIPIRRKRSENPEVFGFRVVAGHVGSFAKTAQVSAAEQTSLSFINGVPVFERFFLGDEFTIRGYSTRSISPLVPLDFFLSSRDVNISATPSGTVEGVPNLPTSLSEQLIALGTFTGAGGSNSLQLSQRDARFLGGDTQLLGNFEYRIPIYSRILSAALFADVGTSFNLRGNADQTFSSDFLADDPFLLTLGVANLTSLVGRNNPQIALGPATGGLILRDNRLVTKEEFSNALRAGPTDPLSGLPFGFQEVFLRGDVQTNTVARLSESLFSKFSDIRSSVGGELRIQLPVVNVPFRLIYAFNPNARNQEVPGIPGLFIRDKKRLFRFSIGRTF
jgi:outer membrane protein insertion porin family